MPIRGPLATLLAVAAAGAAVVTTNVVLTAEPSAVEQPAAALSASSGGYAAAPAAPQQSTAPVRYDGRSAGDEVTVQVTVENGQAKAYLCNRAKGIDTWVEGAVTDGRMQLTGDDGASVEATSDGKAVFGTAAAKGKSWPFAAAVSTDAAPAATPQQAPAPVEQPQAPAGQSQAPAAGDSYGGY